MERSPNITDIRMDATNVKSLRRAVKCNMQNVFFIMFLGTIVLRVRYDMI